MLLFSLLCYAQLAQTNLQNKREKKLPEKLLPLTTSVILVILDGLRNEDLRNPRLNIPVLKSLRDRGSSVLNVESVYPSQSLPAQTTILTGMLPADHGIISDGKFDEIKGITSSERFEAVSEIKTETIWQAAKRNGLKTGAINLPFGNPADLEVQSQDENIISDWIENKPPQLLIIRFEELATSIQLNGVGSAEANAALESIDISLKKISDAIERKGKTNETTFLIVSSHGYAKVEQEFKPNVLLAKKGFLSLDAKGNITNWIATTRSFGGAAAIYFKNSKDEEKAKDIENSFIEIYKQEASPIWRIISKKDAAKLGADPRAVFFIETAPGVLISEQTLGKKVMEKLKPTSSRAISGYLPSRSEMRGVLITAGKGIKPKTQIEYARLSDIAPTIARLLGFELKASRGHVLSEILIQPK